MPDSVEEFLSYKILRQGRISGVEVDPPKISLCFSFPRWFEVHFTGVVDYRAEMPIFDSGRITNWSASRQSEYLDDLPRRRLRWKMPPLRDPEALCHFHMTFDSGYLDVIGRDFAFVMYSSRE